MSSRHQLGEGDGGAYSFCHVRDLKEVERRENFEEEVVTELEAIELEIKSPKAVFVREIQV